MVRFGFALLQSLNSLLSRQTAERKGIAGRKRKVRRRREAQEGGTLAVVFTSAPEAGTLHQGRSVADQASVRPGLAAIRTTDLYIGVWHRDRCVLFEESTLVRIITAVY